MASFSGRDRLRARMKAVPVKVRRALRAQLEANANELVATQKRFADASFSDPSGKLQATIRQQDVSDSTRISRKISAGSREVPYAAWVEFGTSKNPPKPYFMPAYRLLKRRFKSRLSRAAKKALKEGS